MVEGAGAILALLVAGAAAYVGFALLALSQRAHRSAVTGGTPESVPPARLRRRSSWLGAGALLVSFLVNLRAAGPSFGCLLGVFVLSAAAVAVTFTLTWRPRWLRHLRPAFAPRLAHAPTNAGAGGRGRG